MYNIKCKISYNILYTLRQCGLNAAENVDTQSKLKTGAKTIRLHVPQLCKLTNCATEKEK